MTAGVFAAISETSPSLVRQTRWLAVVPSWMTATGVDPSRPVDAQIRHLGTEPLEEATGLDRRRVFDLGGDNVVRTASSGEEGTFDREVVGLAATAREDDFVGRTAEECRDLASRGLQH